MTAHVIFVIEFARIRTTEYRICGDVGLDQIGKTFPVDEVILVATSKSTSAGTATPPWESLRKLIEREGYKSGDQLPPERELALKLGVGRPAIREAIKALSILEVIESRRGSGTFIKSGSNLNFNWPEGSHAAKPDFDMLQLLEVRKMIEPQAAFLSASRSTVAQLGELEHQLIIQERIGDDREAVAKSDFLFHDIIMQSAGNSVLEDLVRFLSPMLVRSRQITAFAVHDLTRMIREHRAIFEAIRRGHPDLAARVMTEHLLSVGVDLLTGPENPPHRADAKDQLRRPLSY